jgi:hypothetical protein
MQHKYDPTTFYENSQLVYWKGQRKNTYLSLNSRTRDVSDTRTTPEINDHFS